MYFRESDTLFFEFTFFPIKQGEKLLQSILINWLSALSFYCIYYGKIWQSYSTITSFIPEDWLCFLINKSIYILSHVLLLSMTFSRGNPSAPLMTQFIHPLLWFSSLSQCFSEIASHVTWQSSHGWVIHVANGFLRQGGVLLQTRSHDLAGFWSLGHTGIQNSTF